MRLVDEDARAREGMSNNLNGGYFRQDHELFEYNRDELQNGEFYHQKQLLKGKMIGSLANILCEVFLLCWLMIYFPS
jgi:hypothetical protein